MKFNFHPEAQEELFTSAEYYETRQENLGMQFITEVYSTIQLILEFPLAFPKQSVNTRRCIINRFPFAIIYQVREDEIFIAAIAHLARKPGYWKERIN